MIWQIFKNILFSLTIIWLSFLPPIYNYIKIGKTYSSDELVKRNFMEIHVEGLKIFNKYGEEVQLKGVVSNEFRDKNKIYDNLDILKEKILFFQKKGVNLIVLYLDTPKILNSRKKEIVDLVEWANSNNIYVLLYPVVNEVYTMNGKNAKEIKYGSNDDRLDDLMFYFSRQLKSYDNVLYGTGAEPHGIEIKKIVQKQYELINVIRKNKDNAIIVINGIDWGSNLKPYLENPINEKNILYDVHYYPAKNKENLKFEYCKIQNNLDKKLPLMFGEFGGVHQKDFGSDEDLQCFKLLLDEFNNKKISFSVFTIDQNTGLGLYSYKYKNEDEISEKGKIFIEYLEQ